jgi:hypothetical protein
LNNPNEPGSDNNSNFEEDDELSLLCLLNTIKREGKNDENMTTTDGSESAGTCSDPSGDELDVSFQYVN